MGIRGILRVSSPNGEATPLPLRHGEDLVRLHDGTMVSLEEYRRTQQHNEAPPPPVSPLFGRTTRAQDGSGEFGPPTAGITDPALTEAVTAIALTAINGLTGTQPTLQQSLSMDKVFPRQYPGATRETHGAIPSAVVERQPGVHRWSPRKIGVLAVTAVAVTAAVTIGVKGNILAGSDKDGQSTQYEQSLAPTEFVLQSVVGAQLSPVEFTAGTSTTWDFLDDKKSNALGPKDDETWFDLKTTGKINWTINAVYDPADTKKSAIVETTKAADKKTGVHAITIDLRKIQLAATVTDIDSPDIPFFKMETQKQLNILKGSKVAGSATLTVASLKSFYDENIGGVQNRQVAYALDETLKEPAKRRELLHKIEQTIREQLGLTNNPAVSITFTGEDKAFLPAKPTDLTKIAAEYLKETGPSELVQLYSTEKNPAFVKLTPDGQGT